MQKKYLVIFVTVLICFAATSTFGFGGGSSMPAAESAPPVVTEKMNALTILVQQEGTKEILEVPLFSEKYAQLPVATVNEEPITLKKFALELATMHGSMTESENRGSQNLTKMLNRLITVKLVKQEALNIGFDRTPAVQKQIENFALETMIKQLLAEQLSDIRVEVTEVEELYQQMAIEVKISAYKVFDQADAETLLEDSRAAGDFKQLADKLVETAKAEGGGTPEYVRLNELLPAVAKEAYALEKGNISQIFKEENGFMLFKLEDKRVYEDAEVRQAAANQVFQQQAKIAQREYLQSLED
ncbi:MAG: peptidylprolyl isomerase [Spirochaetales bacterium]|jgi:parvulin-like peptidyl-prolyl isomerase|nr:peptidylprolyl isomerase [Spirochaetales bacterium]